MASFLTFLERNSDRLLRLTLEHVQVVLLALAIGAVLGVGLGVLVARSPRWSALAIGTTGLVLTVPSFAAYSLLVTAVGLGTTPVVVALVLYSLFPIVRNTVVGLNGVDPAVVESARGVGMGTVRRLLRVELPMAWPVVLTGVRVSGVLLVGIAALGEIVNGPGLGELLFAGLRTFSSPNAVDLALSGTLLIVAIAVVLDLAFLALARLTTSKGLR